MSLYASLAGVRVTSATLTTPYWGLWCADVELADATALPSQSTLTIGNLSRACAVVRQAAFTGNRTARLVGGFGGWRKVVGPRAYSNPAGVGLGLVLRDLAADVGEQVTVAADAAIGTYFVREAAKASRILRQLAGTQWWVDAAGVTHTGARPSARVATDFLATRYAGNEGRFSIATEDLASWVPGATFASALFDGVQTVSSVSLAMAKDGKLRLDVLAGAPDRLLTGFDDLVDAEGPQDTFRGVWEYSVTSATASTFDGLPTSTDFPLPPLVGIPFRPGLAGASFTPAAGSLVLVAFANADPRRPVVVAWDGAVPAGTAIDSTGVMTVGTSATALYLAGGKVVVPAGLEAGRPVCYGDTLVGPVTLGAPLTVALAVPGTTPVSRVVAQ